MIVGLAAFRDNGRSMLTELFLDSGNRDAVQRLTDDTLISRKDRWDDVIANGLCFGGSLDKRQGILHEVNEDTIYISA